jgi:PHP family Zn ribbon phosphoesterase
MISNVVFVLHSCVEEDSVHSMNIVNILKYAKCYGKNQVGKIETCHIKWYSYGSPQWKSDF